MWRVILVLLVVVVAAETAFREFVAKPYAIEAAETLVLEQWVTGVSPEPVRVPILSAGTALRETCVYLDICLDPELLSSVDVLLAFNPVGQGMVRVLRDCDIRHCSRVEKHNVFVRDPLPVELEALKRARRSERCWSAPALIYGMKICEFLLLVDDQVVQRQVSARLDVQYSLRAVFRSEAQPVFHVGIDRLLGRIRTDGARVRNAAVQGGWDVVDYE